MLDIPNPNQKNYIQPQLGKYTKDDISQTSTGCYFSYFANKIIELVCHSQRLQGLSTKHYGPQMVSF